MNKFFGNLFGKKKQLLPGETAPLSEEDTKQAIKLSFEYKPSQMILGCAQSVGLQRDHNEDALFAINTILSEGNLEFPFGVFIIADGMGGHQHGELASGAAARVMGEHLVSKLYLPLVKSDSIEQGATIQEVLEEGVDKVQNEVHNKVTGSGTTLTIAVVAGGQVTTAHVGDSRCYFISSSGQIEVVTHDHSLVQRLLDLNQITEAEARVHPQRNVLYRAIGQDEPFQADIDTRPIPKPGYMLLCSDGLWGQVSNEEIARLVISSINPSVACHKLVDAANAAGGPDNISAILVQFLE